MDSIKNLDLFLFKGILEQPIRHYAQDLQALEVFRGTRQGIADGSACTNDSQSDIGSNFDFDDVTYSFDENLGSMVMNIT